MFLRNNAAMYSSLYRASVGVDFMLPQSTHFSDYNVILVPPLYIGGDLLLIRPADYVRSGGNLVVTFKSGFCNEYSAARWEMAPGPLREAAGLHFQEFSHLREPLALMNDPLTTSRSPTHTEQSSTFYLRTLFRMGKRSSGGPGMSPSWKKNKGSSEQMVKEHRE
jgi:hypothetical protein